MDAPDSLKVDLRSLEKGPRAWTVHIPVEEGPWSNTGLAFAERPVAELAATLTGERGVHVRGSLAAPLELECRRCLEAMPKTLELDLDLLFDRDVDPDSAEPEIYPLESEATVLDLGPVLREQLLLAVPGYPVCREECRGLCPKCGTNLNEDDCDCVLTEPDPRWDALRKLKESESAAG